MANKKIRKSLFMNLSTDKFLPDVDKFTDETEEYTRKILSKYNKWQGIDKTFKVFFSFLKSVTKNLDFHDAKNSNLHYKIGVSIKSIRILLPYFYLSLKGFYDEANILIRNFVELSLVLIDIGYNNQSLIFWKNGKSGEFSEINNILKRIEKNKDNIPELDLKAADYLKSKYHQLSGEFSHELRLQNIEKLFKSDGSVKFSDRANEDFTLKRADSFKALILNATSLLIGVTNYSSLVNSNPSQYPEAMNLKNEFESFLKQMATL